MSEIICPECGSRLFKTPKGNLVCEQCSYKTKMIDEQESEFQMEQESRRKEKQEEQKREKQQEEQRQKREEPFISVKETFNASWNPKMII